jgi:hypothetical protein
MVLHTLQHHTLQHIISLGRLKKLHGSVVSCSCQKPISDMTLFILFYYSNLIKSRKRSVQHPNTRLKCGAGYSWFFSSHGALRVRKVKFQCPRRLLGVKMELVKQICVKWSNNQIVPSQTACSAARKISPLPFDAFYVETRRFVQSFHFPSRLQYLDPVRYVCVSSCGVNMRGSGFSSSGRRCVPATVIRERRSLAKTEPRGKASSQEYVLARSRRFAFQCTTYNVYFYWTGCNYGGCKSKDREVARDYCVWKAVYDEKCRVTDTNNCNYCENGFYRYLIGSFAWCNLCRLCSSNQYRSGTCERGGNGIDFSCTSCGIATVGGKIGAFVPTSSSVPEGTTRRQTTLRSTLSTANSNLGFSACTCPSKYSRT